MTRPSKDEVDAALAYCEAKAYEGDARVSDDCLDYARILASEVRHLRATKIDGPHETFFQLTCPECGHKASAKIPAVHVVQVWPTAAALLEARARVEALPAKWRGEADILHGQAEYKACGELEAAADELEAALEPSP